jgi:hypothetical protein
MADVPDSLNHAAAYRVAKENAKAAIIQPDRVLARLSTKKRSVFDRQEGGKHYDLPVDTAYFCIMNKLECAESAIVKYAVRHERKNGAEDIKKLIHYAQMILEVKYGITPDV